MINYTPFFNTLEKMKITQYQLKYKFFIPSSVISRMKKNKSITLNTIENICKILKCNIDDIVTFT